MADRKETSLIVIHCSATYANMDIGADEINEWHKERGWRMIGYHDVIKRNGTLEFGRDINEIGAHAKGYNKESVGVCLIGGIDKNDKPENNFTDAQFKTLLRCLRYYKALFPKAKVVGHRDLNPYKNCPCFDVGQWLEDVVI